MSCCCNCSQFDISELSDMEVIKLFKRKDEIEEKAKRMSSEVHTRINAMVEAYAKKGKTPRIVKITEEDLWTLTGSFRFGVEMHTAVGKVSLQRAGGFVGGEGQWFNDGMSVEE